MKLSKRIQEILKISHPTSSCVQDSWNYFRQNHEINSNLRLVMGILKQNLWGIQVTVSSEDRKYVPFLNYGHCWIEDTLKGKAYTFVARNGDNRLLKISLPIKKYRKIMEAEQIKSFDWYDTLMCKNLKYQKKLKGYWAEDRI